MNWLNRLSIQGKVVAVSMIASGVALVLACAGFASYELLTFRATITGQLETISQVVLDSSTAALTFDDQKDATEMLSVLRGQPRIVAGCIYTRQGRILATYQRAGAYESIPALPREPREEFSDGHIILYREIVLDREQVGTLYLKRDLSDFDTRIRRYSGIVFLVLGAASLAAFLLTNRLQKVISVPILKLAETASRVSTEENYGLRAEKITNDELSVLVDRFNEMMEQIQSRDQALLEAQDELEDRVNVRTAELQSEIRERQRVQEDLLVAKVAAEESNKAKTAFLANMSHELRTPLNAILGYSELLEEEALDRGTTESVPDLKRIQQAGKQLLTLIGEVLDLSKIEAGRMELCPEWFSLPALVSECVATVETVAKKNGNQFSSELAPGLMEIYGDQVKIRQSVLNLLSNACKFTKDGTVTLRVESGSSQRCDVVVDSVDGGNGIAFHVEDTGIGIAAEHLGRLFRVFTQVDTSTARKYGGTGLGLALSRRLCQMMGGDIQVQSEIGKGSRFSIWLPQPRRDQPAESRLRPSVALLEQEC
jgi:signal transduction histidine kinase